MDWNFIFHNAHYFVDAGYMTVFISMFGVIFSIVLGVLCAPVEVSKIPLLRQIVHIYIELSRNTPPSANLNPRYGFGAEVRLYSVPKYSYRQASFLVCCRVCGSPSG